MDKNYWEQVYSKQNSISLPSLFAKFVLENYTKPQDRLVELGCGNGRDAVFFANNNISVLAIDQCSNEIDFLASTFQANKNIDFIAGDFTALEKSATYKSQIVYSRFTLHSIKENQETDVCNWAYAVLQENGFFCIEVRGQKNEIYKLGEQAENEEHAYIYNNHYRRFLDFVGFQQKLETIGFAIEFAAEEKGFAPFNGDNETYIRIIAKKIC